MVNEQDRTKILAFVHGELDQLETQKLAERIESDAELRREFEAMLETSDALEDLFLKPATEDLSIKQIEGLLAKADTVKPIKSRKQFYIAAAGVFAASVAFVVSMQLHEQKDEPVEFAHINDVAKQVPDVAANAPMPSPPAEPVQPAAQAEAANTISAEMSGTPPAAASAATPAPEEPKARMVVSSKQKAKSTHIGAMQRKQAEPEIAQAEPPALEKPADAFGMKSSFVAGNSEADETAPTAAEVSSKKMGVIASKAKFSPGMNAKKALVYIQQKLDGKTTCVPAELSSLKSIQAVVTVDKTGMITKVQTTPASPDTAKCLKTKLAGKPAVFKSNAGGRITLQIKNF